MVMQVPRDAVSSPSPSSFDTSPSKAWTDALAQATANSPQPSVKAKKGDTLSCIASRYHDSLASVEAANPQIHCPNLLHPGETIYLPKTTPAQIVAGVPDSQIKPIIAAMANANAADEGVQAALRTDDPTLIAAAYAQQTKSWNAVQQATYNMLLHNNVNGTPDVTAAAEVQQLNALEPGNTEFADVNNAALAEAKQTFAQLNYGPVVAAYNNAQQVTTAVNSYLQNPHNPHNRVIVSDLLGEEQQANDALTAAIDKAFSNAVDQTGNPATTSPAARAAAINAAASELEALGPQTAAFRTAVENAKNASTSMDFVGWQPPTDWQATSTSSSHPGSDPFNIIISGNSNVTLSQFLAGLEAVDPAGGPSIPVPGARGPVTERARWAPVPASTSFFNPGTGPEYANVQPDGQGGQPVQQQVSMRVGGQQTETDGNINHFRLYAQRPLPGDHQGTLFIADSIESFHFDWLNSYHNIASNGYNQGRDDLLKDIYAAGQAEGWNVQLTKYREAPNGGTGSNGVSYDGWVYVVTLTHKTSGSATS
jgi:LysM repeat protein